MGIFKSAKKVLKSKIGKIALTAAATYFAGPAGLGLSATQSAVAGGAAGLLLGGGGGKKASKPDAGGVPASPLAALPPVTADAALRAQEVGQEAVGGSVLGGAGVDLLGETSVDEIKRRRASRTLLG